MNGPPGSSARRPAPAPAEEPLDLEVERIPRGRDRAEPPAPRRPVAFAFAVAMAADALQWALVPLFPPAATGPWNNVLDLAVAVVLVRLLGWHWAFLPTFLVELIPVVDLVPTWTMAVWVATRGRRR